MENKLAIRAAEEIERREPINGIRLVGVDGPAGSGKSTFANALAEILDAPIIEIDDFVSWDSAINWWPRFDEQVLTPLLAGRDAHYQFRDWQNDWEGSSLAGWKTQPWAPIVIFEGVTCTRQATIGRLAYAAWVEAPPEMRLARGLARNSNPALEGLWKKFAAEEDVFFPADGARDRADIIVDTSQHG